MQTFKKTERLRSKKLIERLFNQGNTIKNYPFKIVWLENDIRAPFPAQVLVSVSRRTFKRAVDRNKIKRRIKEAYRHHKNALYEYLNEADKHLIFAIVYTGRELLKYNDIERKIIDSLKRLIEDNEKTIK